MACLAAAAVIAMAIAWVGCEETDLINKQDADIKKKIKDIHKVTVETKDIVEGDHNTLTEVHDNSKLTVQHFNEIINNTNEQTAKSAKVTAEHIDNVFQQVNNNNNSTWLMIVLNFFSFTLNVIMLLILALVIRKLIKMKFQVTRVIAADDNDLNDEKWAAHAKI